jgi:hypothetical protein
MNTLNKQQFDSIFNELFDYATERVDEMARYENVMELEFDELHHQLFNEDYYIIGYYEGKKWLESHGVDPLEAVSHIIASEQLHFGEVSLSMEDMNHERIANLFVYCMGWEIQSDLENYINDNFNK